MNAPMRLVAALLVLVCLSMHTSRAAKLDLRVLASSDDAPIPPFLPSSSSSSSSSSSTGMPFYPEMMSSSSSSSSSSSTASMSSSSSSSSSSSAMSSSSSSTGSSFEPNIITPAIISIVTIPKLNSSSANQTTVALVPYVPNLSTIILVIPLNSSELDNSSLTNGPVVVAIAVRLAPLPFASNSSAAKAGLSAEHSLDESEASAPSSASDAGESSSPDESSPDAGGSFYVSTLAPISSSSSSSSHQVAPTPSTTAVIPRSTALPLHLQALLTHERQFYVADITVDSVAPLKASVNNVRAADAADLNNHAQDEPVQFSRAGSAASRALWFILVCTLIPFAVCCCILFCVCYACADGGSMLSGYGGSTY